MKKQNVKELFAAELKRAREAAGTSQKTFAEAVEVKQPTISEIEGGNANITAESIQKYADEFKLTVVFKLVKPRPKKEKEKLPRMDECTHCDGTGWCEGGKALRTTCDNCNGSGQVERK